MSTNVTARWPRDGCHWAHGERLGLAGTLPCWVGLAVVVTGLAAMSGVGLQRIGLWSLHPVLALLERNAASWTAFSTVVVATIGRCVARRAGRLVIDLRRAAAR